MRRSAYHRESRSRLPLLRLRLAPRVESPDSLDARRPCQPWRGLRGVRRVASLKAELVALPLIAAKLPALRRQNSPQQALRSLVGLPRPRTS